MQEYPGLTQAQKSVAELMLLGLSNKEISGRLGNSDKTVKYHITEIFKVAGVRTRHEFMAQHYRAKIAALQKRLDQTLPTHC